MKQARASAAVRGNSHTIPGWGRAEDGAEAKATRNEQSSPIHAYHGLLSFFCVYRCGCFTSEKGFSHVEKENVLIPGGGTEVFDGENVVRCARDLWRR